jgi:transformation/transcription domain-associated protein
MRCDWDNLKRLRETPAVVALLERGSLLVKLTDIMLSVIDNRSTDVERNCAQAVQLALNLWQMLPQCCGGSVAHRKLLSSFHRIIELRESASVSLEIYKSAKDKKIPDLKTVLRNWRHRIPEETCGSYFINPSLEWRITIFAAIKNAFQTNDPNQVAALHDTPWTYLAMAKIGRKRHFDEVSLTSLARLRTSVTMDIQSAFTKLREQILWCLSPTVNDYLGGINIINATNLEYFSPQQKAELFRLKGICLRRSGDSYQAAELFSQSVQISSTYGKSWLSWSHACYDDFIAHTYSLSSYANAGSSKYSDPVWAGLVSSQLKAAKSVIACTLKAVECDSGPAQLLLSRVIFLLLSLGSIHPEIIQTFLQYANNIVTWKWLLSFNDLLSWEQADSIMSFLSKICNNHPYTVVLKLLWRKSLSVSKLANISGSSPSLVPDKLLQELKSIGYDGLVSSAESLVSALEEMSELSLEGQLYVGCHKICQSITHDENLSLDRVIYNDSLIQADLMLEAYHSNAYKSKTDIDAVSKIRQDLLERFFTGNMKTKLQGMTVRQVSHE